MNNHGELNAALAAAYTVALSRWERMATGALDSSISKPLLMSVPPLYAETRHKLMVVGQETLGWGEERTLNARDLMEEYDAWALGKAYQTTPFWAAARQVANALNGPGGMDGFLWTNLVKVNGVGGRPASDVEEAVSSLGLLQKEIEITRPDVVVFFTGPNYDGRLVATFPGVTFEQTSSTESLRCLATVRHRQLPTRSFRTYHPAYLRRRGKWSVLDAIAKATVAELS